MENPLSSPPPRPLSFTMKPGATQAAHRPDFLAKPMQRRQLSDIPFRLCLTPMCQGHAWFQRKDDARAARAGCSVPDSSQTLRPDSAPTALARASAFGSSRRRPSDREPRSQKVVPRKWRGTHAVPRQVARHAPIGVIAVVVLAVVVLAEQPSGATHRRARVRTAHDPQCMAHVAQRQDDRLCTPCASLPARVKSMP